MDRKYASKISYLDYGKVSFKMKNIPQKKVWTLVYFDSSIFLYSLEVSPQ